jgi:hypothetical protein
MTFGDSVLAHLDTQLVSARRLLDLVLQQAAAVRQRDPEGVLACLAEIQGEMERRGRLERERTQLLQHAAMHANVPAHEVDVELLITLIPEAHGVAARSKSAELRGLLAEIAREHLVNRALMRQELSFLDHLTRLIGDDEPLGYRPTGAMPGTATQGGANPAPAVHRVLDLQA